MFNIRHMSFRQPIAMSKQHTMIDTLFTLKQTQTCMDKTEV